MQSTSVVRHRQPTDSALIPRIAMRTKHPNMQTAKPASTRLPRQKSRTSGSAQRGDRRCTETNRSRKRPPSAQRQLFVVQFGSEKIGPAMLEVCVAARDPDRALARARRLARAARQLVDLSEWISGLHPEEYVLARVDASYLKPEHPPGSMAFDSECDP